MLRFNCGLAYNSYLLYEDFYFQTLVHNQHYMCSIQYYISFTSVIISWSQSYDSQVYMDTDEMSVSS